MKTKQLFGVLGSIVLFVGVFTPLISLPIVGSINYFGNGKGDGIFILVLAAASLILALTRLYEGLWLTGTGSLAVLTFTFVNFEVMRQHMTSTIDKDLAGNPFAGLAQLAVNSVQIQWGWALLLVGAGMILTSAALKDARHTASSAFPVHFKALAVLFVVASVAVGTWGADQISEHRPKSKQTTAAGMDSTPGNSSERRSTEVTQYLSNIELSQVKGGMAKGTLTCYDHECPALWGKIKNNGDRVVSRLIVTAYFPDSSGKVIYEKAYPAISVGGFMGTDSPLRPGYVKEFGYVVKDCPSECVPDRVRVSVTDLEFAANESPDSHQ